MPDLPLTALDVRQQKLFENARRAYRQGNLEYVITVCAQVLQAAPGCLPVRRLQHGAQLQQSSGPGGWMGKTFSGLTALSFALSYRRRTPVEALAQSNKILSKDPHNIMGLQLLAEAATANDWPETAAFAHEAIYEKKPTDRSNLLALGEAWLTAQNPDAALRVADEMLKTNPVDGAAQNLMRQASIARTTEEGQWDLGGDFREKLSNQAESVLAEPVARPSQTETSPPVESAAPKAAKPVDPLAAARDLVERYPGDMDARFGLAEILYGVGQVEAAIAQYQQAAKSPKFRIKSRLGLARCFGARGLHDLAIAQLIAAKQELGPTDGVKKQIVYELGSCYEKTKQPELAIAEFKVIYTEDIGFRDVAAKINTYYSRPTKDQ